MKVEVRYASLYRDAESDLRRLQDIFPALELQEHFQLSAEPPAWLQFISDAMTWKLVFGTAATAYITALAKHLADATWESRKSVRPLVVAACGALIKSFRDFYAALLAIRQ